MKSIPSRWSAFCAVLAVLVPVLATAAGVIKPLPEVDLSALPPAKRTVVVDARRQFDEARPSLVGLYLAEAFAHLGAVYARNGLLEAARAALANASAVEPDDGRFIYLQAVFSLQDGKPELALGQLKEALAKDQNYLPIRYRLALLQLDGGDIQGARETLTDLATKRPDLAPAIALQGEIAMREKRYAEAINWLDRALKVDPQASALHSRRADALQAMGDTKAALAARALAGPVLPGYADPLVEGIYAAPRRPPADYALALAAEGKHLEATQLLDRALAAEANDADLLAAYARVEADRGNIAAGNARADAALKLAPNSVGAHLAKGMLLEMASKDAEASLHYEQAVRADLESAEARLALGNALMRAQKWSAAVEQYRALLKLEQGIGSAAGRLAAGLALNGRCTDGLQETNNALRERPRDGRLLQTFVRVAASCPGASAEELVMAVDYAQAIYKQLPDEGNSEALAMAMMATGKQQDAIDFQAQAMFEAAKRNDQAGMARMRTQLERFKAGQRAQYPWPADHPLMTPPRLVPSKGADRAG